MRTDNTNIKKCAEDFVPEAPESYERMITDTVSALKAKDRAEPKRVRRVWKPLAAAAAVLAALVIAAGAVFGSRPALAADIPGLSGLVYAASPKRTANAADRERIGSLVGEGFRALAAGDQDAASRCFSENALTRRGSFLAAAYLNYRAAILEARPADANALGLEIAEISAEQKAFRYTARVAFDFVSKDGSKTNAEECTVRIWENTEGMHIESVDIESKEHYAYVSRYEAVFGAVPESGVCSGFIPTDNGYLAYAEHFIENEAPHQRIDRLDRLLEALEAVPASRDDKAVRLNLIQTALENARGEITPEVLSAEETAAELMYRYWLGRKTGEAGELADIMERNEDTDLFFIDALLNAEQVSLGVLKPLVSVEKDSAHILEVLDETDDILKARFYVYTAVTDGISEGVGEEIVLSLRKDAAGFTVIGFDRETGDGLYTGSLKPLAARYKAEGRSWQEAGEMAYNEVHAQLLRDAEWVENH